MELLYFFLGVACALTVGLLIYAVFLQSHHSPDAGQFVQGGAERESVVLRGCDF